MSAETSQSTIAAPSRPQTPDDDDDDFWTADPTCFDIDLDCNQSAGPTIEEFEDNELWHQTCLRVITAKRNTSNFLDVQNSFLNDRQAMTLGSSQEDNDNIFELFSISRILQKERDQRKLPSEEFGMLRVSPRVLRHLTSTYHIPTAFLTSVVRSYDFCGTAFRRQSQYEWDYWCLLPIRIWNPCAGGADTHAKSTAGSNQMDPFNYIHLEAEKMDIRGSTIALYMKRDCKTRKTQVLIVSLVDQRWRSKIQPPLAQVQKALERRSSMDLDGSPCFVLLVYIAFILRWWNSVLLCFNQELVNYERRLQKEIANETEGFINTSKVLNVALHTMAAHLHRYKTELQRVGLVLNDLRNHREDMTYKPKPKPKPSDEEEGEKEREENGEEEKEDEQEELPPIDRERQKIEQLASQLTAISSFSDEMEKKVQNILALLFNQIQAINDKTLQAILNASQQETRISQRLSLASHMLSRSMKRDSIAMKTIAIMTLVFLPGATFAAVFAMPFFTENKYLSTPSQVWIWVILTVICTAFAFSGYVYLVKRGEKTLGDPEDDNDSIVPPQSVNAPNASSTVNNGQNASSGGNTRY